MGIAALCLMPDRQCRACDLAGAVRLRQAVHARSAACNAVISAAHRFGRATAYISAAIFFISASLSSPSV
ncbi:hypothetical protein J169_04497 [Xanthomonas citri pv. citri]|nr:hypothetical protein J169_04497 [Xanthomonas citri pv. citri]